MSYHLLRIFVKLISHIPFFLLYPLSEVIYFFAYFVIRYRRDVVRKNLSECFPEKSPAEIKKIEKEFYHFFADNLLETFKMMSMSSKEMSRRMQFKNIETVNEAIRNGKSIGLFLGHYANWEWISSMPLHLDPAAVPAQIYHKLSNPVVDRIMLENRAAHGATNVEMRSTARFISRLNSENKSSIIGFIADQAPRTNEINYYLPFLNHLTPVLTGTEKIIKHFNFEPWFVKTRRLKRGVYEAEFIKMNEIDPELPDFQLTDLYYRMLEEMIREKPELYLWSHKRFRSAKPLPRNIDNENGN